MTAPISVQKPNVAMEFSTPAGSSAMTATGKAAMNVHLAASCPAAATAMSGPASKNAMMVTGSTAMAAPPTASPPAAATTSCEPGSKNAMMAMTRMAMTAPETADGPGVVMEFFAPIGALVNSVTRAVTMAMSWIAMAVATPAS